MLLLLSKRSNQGACKSVFISCLLCPLSSSSFFPTSKYMVTTQINENLGQGGRADLVCHWEDSDTVIQEVYANVRGHISDVSTMNPVKPIHIFKGLINMCLHCIRGSDCIILIVTSHSPIPIFLTTSHEPYHSPSASIPRTQVCSTLTVLINHYEIALFL